MKYPSKYLVYIAPLVKSSYKTLLAFKEEPTPSIIFKDREVTADELVLLLESIKE